MKNWLLFMAKNKWLHILVFIVIACAVTLIDAAEHYHSGLEAASIGAVVAIGLSLLKGIVWDVLFGWGTFRIKNLFAGAVGSIIGFFLSWGLMVVGAV